MEWGHITNNILDNARRSFFRLKKGEEAGGDVDKAGKVNVHFPVECRQVDSIRFAEIVDTLHSCIKEDAIKVRVGTGHGMHKFVQVFAVADIIRDPTAFIAVFVGKCVKSVLSAAHGNDFGTFADELLRHAEADA